MPKITAKRKQYCLMKIEMLDKLVENATSPEQKTIYEGFRQKFVDELPKKDDPKIIAEKAIRKEEKMLADAILAAEIEDNKRIEAERETEREAKQATILKQIEDLKRLLPKVEEEISETVEILEELKETEDDNGQTTVKQTSDD